MQLGVVDFELGSFSLFIWKTGRFFYILLVLITCKNVINVGFKICFLSFSDVLFKLQTIFEPDQCRISFYFKSLAERFGFFTINFGD